MSYINKSLFAFLIYKGRKPERYNDETDSVQLHNARHAFNNISKLNGEVLERVKDEYLEKVKEELKTLIDSKSPE